MTRLSQLLFVIHVTTVIFLVTHKYVYITYWVLPYNTYAQHTGYLFLDAINPLHVVYGL